MKIKNMKQTKGITLIALVITIIVLLILAGVAISMLSGENGILNRAADAKKQTEESNELEEIKLAVMAAMTNDKFTIENVESLQQELDKQLNGEATATGNATSGYEIKKGDNVYKVSSNGVIEKQEPEILESDIWSMTLINPLGDESVHHYKWIKLKSKYKKVSLKEYKEQCLFDKVINGNEMYSNMDFDDMLILEGKAVRNTWSINRRRYRIY